MMFGIRCLQPATRSGGACGYPTQKPEALLERIIKRQQQRRRPRRRLLLRQRHDRCGRRAAGPALDHGGPGPLRHPHQPQAPHRISSASCTPKESPTAPSMSTTSAATSASGGRRTGSRARRRSTAAWCWSSSRPRSCPTPQARCCTGARQARSVTWTASTASSPADEARAVAEAVAAAGGREAYCLAWEFEMELRQHCLALEAELGVKIKLIAIPREIMEKNRKSPPPFLEMAVLEAEAVRRKDGGKTVVDVKLTRFLPSLAEVPGRELEALKERAVEERLRLHRLLGGGFRVAAGPALQPPLAGLPHAQGPQPQDRERCRARLRHARRTHHLREGGGRVRLRHQHHGGGGHMIERITVENFKSLKNVDLRLGAVEYLHRNNASGKSNFFDALRVLQGIGNGFTSVRFWMASPRAPPARSGRRFAGVARRHCSRASATGAGTRFSLSAMPDRSKPKASANTASPSHRDREACRRTVGVVTEIYDSLIYPASHKRSCF